METLSRRRIARLALAGLGIVVFWPGGTAFAATATDSQPTGAGGWGDALTAGTSAVPDGSPDGQERRYVLKLVDDPDLDSVYAHATPATASDVVGSIPYGAPVPVLSQADGEKLWYGDTTWYKVALTYGAGWLYGPLLGDQPNVAAAPPLPPPVPRPAYTPDPVGNGQSIVVSLADQFVWAFEGGRVALAVGCTTGGKGLETPRGDFAVKKHVRNYTFNSPWPKGSAYYYDSVQASYALLFDGVGYFLHDAPWRRVFGPASQGGTGPLGKDHTGSHGCVNLPYWSAKSLFAWAADGTPVRVL